MPCAVSIRSRFLSLGFEPLLQHRDDMVALVGSQVVTARDGVPFLEA